MKIYFKKFSIMFAMAFAIILGCCTSAFAADDFEIGTDTSNITVEECFKYGSRLEHPNKGWKRYQEDNVNIKYLGDGWEKLHYYNGDTKRSKKNLNSIIFYAYSDKIRIVGSVGGSYSDHIKVIIDDKEEGYYSQYRFLSTEDSIWPEALLFEKTDMSKELHKIEIKNLKNNKNIDLDSIDIDENGYLIGIDEEERQFISLDKSSLTLKEGETDKLTAATTPSAVDITWSSSDETVAIVDSNGNVKAIKEGQVTITAQIKGTDMKADCIVTVTKEDKEPEPTDPEQKYIINTAYAKGDNTNNASGQVSIIFKGVSESQLKVVKTADVDSVYVGDNFTYTIEVTNTSDKIAKSVVINDSAPNHIQFIPSGVTTTQGTVDSSSTSKNIIVNVGDIPPLGKVIIKIPVLVVE